MVKKCPKSNKVNGNSSLGNSSHSKKIDSSSISDSDSLNIIKEDKDRRNNTNLDINPKKKKSAKN